MKYWQLEQLCRENAYSVKREGRNYFWKKNNSDRNGVCDTILETAEEIKKDINETSKSLQ